MTAKPRQSHPRIQATITGRAGPKARPVNDHERNVMAVTRAIHTLTAERKRLKARLRDVAGLLRFKRRELRALLQRDATVTPENADDRLAEAGKADAIDAAAAKLEV
jgi:hypothetical protein